MSVSIQLQQAMQFGVLPQRAVISAEMCLGLICSDLPLSDRERSWMYQHPAYEVLSRAVQAAIHEGDQPRDIYLLGLEHMDQLLDPALAEEVQKASLDASISHRFAVKQRDEFMDEDRKRAKALKEAAMQAAIA